MVNTSFTDALKSRGPIKPLEMVRRAFAGLCGAYIAQRQYQALAQVSDRTVARLNLSRSQLARQAMSLTTR